MDREASTRRTVPRRGAARSWLLLLGATVVTAGLVWRFVGVLPPPPRFDTLVVEPGSDTPVIRGIVRRMHLESGGDRGTPVGEVELAGWPATEDGETIDHLVYRVPVERPEVVFAVLGFEGRDVEIAVARGAVVLTRGGGEGDFEFESDSVVLPSGASDFRVEVRRRGDEPRFAAWWRDRDATVEPGAPPDRRSMSTLVARGIGAGQAVPTAADAAADAEDDVESAGAAVPEDRPTP